MFKGMRSGLVRIVAGLSLALSPAYVSGCGDEIHYHNGENGGSDNRGEEYSCEKICGHIVSCGAYSDEKVRRLSCVDDCKEECIELCYSEDLGERPDCSLWRECIIDYCSPSILDHCEDLLPPEVYEAVTN